MGNRPKKISRPRSEVRGAESRLKLSVTIMPSVVRKVDAYAEELCWTRSGVIELVLDRELEHVMDRALEVMGRKGVSASE